MQTVQSPTVTWLQSFDYQATKELATARATERVTRDKKALLVTSVRAMQR